MPGIVAKVLNSVVGGGKYYKKKGLVLRVIDRFIGELRMCEGGDVIRIDQAQVETVIPKVRPACALLRRARARMGAARHAPRVRPGGRRRYDREWPLRGRRGRH